MNKGPVDDIKKQKRDGKPDSAFSVYPVGNFLRSHCGSPFLFFAFRFAQFVRIADVVRTTIVGILKRKNFKTSMNGERSLEGDREDVGGEGKGRR